MVVEREYSILLGGIHKNLSPVSGAPGCPTRWHCPVRLCMATTVIWEETLLGTAEPPSGQAQTSLAAPDAALQSILLVPLVHGHWCGVPCALNPPAQEHTSLPWLGLCFILLSHRWPFICFPFLGNLSKLVSVTSWDSENGRMGGTGKYS